MKMIDRVDRILAERGIDQDDFERLAKLPTNRFSKWKRGTGADSVSARYALSMARVLGVSVEWLIDDEAPDEAVESDGLTADERDILNVIRRAGLGKVEALARLALSPPARPATPMRLKERGFASGGETPAGPPPVDADIIGKPSVKGAGEFAADEGVRSRKRKGAS
jgi:transcriptional regulator with XRE-family HTH domain